MKTLLFLYVYFFLRHNVHEKPNLFSKCFGSLYSFLTANGRTTCVTKRIIASSVQHRPSAWTEFLHDVLQSGRTLCTDSMAGKRACQQSTLNGQTAGLSPSCNYASTAQVCSGSYKRPYPMLHYSLSSFYDFNQCFSIALKCLVPFAQSVSSLTLTHSYVWGRKVSNTPCGVQK